jgi:hypothetical protein
VGSSSIAVGGSGKEKERNEILSGKKKSKAAAA